MIQQEVVSSHKLYFLYEKFYRTGQALHHAFGIYFSPGFRIFPTEKT